MVEHFKIRMMVSGKQGQEEESHGQWMQSLAFAESRVLETLLYDHVLTHTSGTVS